MLREGMVDQVGGGGPVVLLDGHGGAGLAELPLVGECTAVWMRK